MGQGHRQLQILVQGHRVDRRFLGVDRDGQVDLCRAGWDRTDIFDTKLQREFLTYDRKGRGVPDNQAPVPITFASGQQDL